MAPSVVEQPFKIPFIAAIVLVINPTKPEVAQEMLVKAGAAIKEHLEAGAWREVKLLLRFLGCLQGLLEGDGVFPILEELFSRAVDLQTASSEDVSIQVPRLSSEHVLTTVNSEFGLGIGQDNPPYASVCHGLLSNRI